MLTRTFSWLTALTIVLSLASVAHAQREIAHIPPLVNPDPTNPDMMQPFISPLAFDPDYQFFAPADISNFGNGVPARIGFFFTYDRMYMNVSRPESTFNGFFSEPWEGDWTWGNRYNLGYMTEEDHGWTLSHIHINGPNFGDETLVGYPDAITPPVGPTPIDVAPVVFQSLERRVESRFASVDFNKTFRSKLHHGAYFEPYFGARYIYFRDFSTDYSRFITGEIDNITEQRVKNQIVLAQIGMRTHVRKGRWILSSDVKGAVGNNFQFHRLDTRTREVFTPPRLITTLFEPNQSLNEFVPMGELRVETQFDITRDLSLRAGMELMYFGRGIGRADTRPVGPVFDEELTFIGPAVPDSAALNDQDLLMVGLTFGFSYNY